MYLGQIYWNGPWLIRLTHWKLQASNAKTIRLVHPRAIMKYKGITLPYVFGKLKVSKWQTKGLFALISPCVFGAPYFRDWARGSLKAEVYQGWDRLCEGLSLPRCPGEEKQVGTRGNRAVALGEGHRLEPSWSRVELI